MPQMASGQQEEDSEDEKCVRADPAYAMTTFLAETLAMGMVIKRTQSGVAHAPTAHAIAMGYEKT